MRILIDADGCLVTDIAENEARRHSIPCIIVCDGSHVFRSDYSRIIITDIGADKMCIRDSIRPNIISTPTAIRNNPQQIFITR